MVEHHSPAAAMSVFSPATVAGGGERKHWWHRNRKVVEKYIREARVLLATRDPTLTNPALSLLDAALVLSPRLELALELKARCLLSMRRFKEIADMLQEYIPSYEVAAAEEDSSGSSTEGSGHSRERVRLLGEMEEGEKGFRCFSVAELKRKFLAGMNKDCDGEGQWRYMVLGQACCHLGLMEDAMLLLQTGKRLAAADFRRQSTRSSDDIFAAVSAFELDSISQLLSQIKLLLRRRGAALAALDAGLHAESIRHFSKILDGRRPAPQAFLAECYLHRANAYRAVGRVADSVADCNRALAFDPSFVGALEARASLFEMIGCIADSLHDLEHLKLLYNSVLRDRKLPGPGWKRQPVGYREVPGKLRALTGKIQELKQRIASGDKGNADYYKLFGLRRGCSRFELERAHLLLVIRHKPDKALGFIARCELADEGDHDSVRDRARLSMLLLYRLIQKGHNVLLGIVTEEEATEEERKKVARAMQETAAIVTCKKQQFTKEPESRPEPVQVPRMPVQAGSGHVLAQEPNAGSRFAIHHGSAFQGVFCRDLAVVGNLLSQAGFNRPLSVKYEALTC